MRDAREAAALVRALGVTRVRVTQHHARAWVVKDRAAIARVLAAIEPGTRTDVAFEGITRETTPPVLAELVAADAHSIFVAGNGATLRVWPRRDEAFVDQLALGRETVFERFRAAAAVTWINGSVSEPGVAASACLPRLFATLDQPELEIDLDVTVDAALALALADPTAELEWTGGIVIQLPTGALSTYHAEPLPAGYEAAWRARVAAALGTVS